MGIPPWTLDLMAKYGAGNGRVLSAGYPDIVVPIEMAEEIVGKEVVAKVARRADTKDLQQWHHADDVKEFLEAESLFKAMGYEGMDVLDVKAWRGGEIICDLNEPLSESLHGKYSMVIDPGTSEHVFHVGVSLISLASCVSQDGIIVQILPLTAFNHGLYCVSPTLLHSFYEENGFRIEWLFAVQRSKPHVQSSVYKVPAHKRFLKAPEETYLGLVARRVEMKKVGPIVQLKYKKKMNETDGNH
ncbi:MAG TPA: hypothetical protein VFU31_24940 [Candidatus Binatia bacterium]|nr:hypothetical protein [Candidatus Binatia bacterium]